MGRHQQQRLHDLDGSGVFLGRDQHRVRVRGRGDLQRNKLFRRLVRDVFKGDQRE